MSSSKKSSEQKLAEEKIKQKLQESLKLKLVKNKNKLKEIYKISQKSISQSSEGTSPIIRKSTQQEILKSQFSIKKNEVDLAEQDAGESGQFSSASSVASLDIQERPLNKASIKDQIQRHKSYMKRTCAVDNQGQTNNWHSNVSYESYGYEQSQFPRPKTRSKSNASDKSDNLPVDESFTINHCCDKQSIQFQKPITPQSRLSQNTKLTASFIKSKKRTPIKDENTFQKQVLKQISSRKEEMRKSHINTRSTVKLKNIKNKVMRSIGDDILLITRKAKQASQSQTIEKSKHITQFEYKFGKQLNVLMRNSISLKHKKRIKSPILNLKDDENLSSRSRDSQGNLKISDQFRKVNNSRNVFKQGLVYHMSKLKMQRNDTNFDEIDQIRQKFITHKIAIVKYNSSIDPSVQNFSSFEGYLQLDPTGKQLIIMNKKPVEKPMYVLEADPNLVKSQQSEFKRQRTERFEKLKTMSQRLRISELSDQPVLLEYHPKEMEGFIDETILREEVEVKKIYQLKKSDSSCLLSDIQGFTFGGVSSRFWLMRKHFNQINFISQKKVDKNLDLEEQYDKAFEFFPWQCISLDMGHSTTFLVIKNEIVMRNFIKLLIHSLKTIDGRRGSASQIHAEMVKKQISETQNVWKNIKLSKDQEDKITKRCWHTIMCKVSFKYLIQKIRGKINYLAFVNQNTVLELFLRSINNSYADFIMQGTLKPEQSFHQINSLYQKITGNSLVEENDDTKTNYTTSQFSVFLLIMQMNIDLGKVNSAKLIESINSKTKPPQKKEAVFVKRKGDQKAKKVIIDEEKEKKFATLIKQMVDKNNVYDLFQQAQVNGKRMYEEKPVIKMLRFKFDMGHWSRMYTKIRLIISLRAVEGELYILLKLWLIQIAKKLFVLEIEQGLETFIPKELSQDHLPMCLRYYDPILNIVYSNVQEERRQYFNLQNNFHIQRIADDDKKLKLFKTLGIISDETYLKKDLVFKPQVINVQSKPPRPNDSSHNMMLQRSKYLIIENDVDQLKKQYYLDKKAAIEMCQPHNDIVLRYCPPEEVNVRRQQFLIFMGCFLNKMNNLKFQGQQIDTMTKIEEFLYENIKTLMKSQGLQKFVKQEIQKKSAKEQINYVFSEHIMIEVLMDYAQDLVLKRRKNLKRVRLDEVKTKLLPENGYQARSTYVERSINDSMKYFTHIPVGDQSDQDVKARMMMLHIRRRLIKQECEIIKMKKRKEEEKLAYKRQNMIPFYRQASLK